MDKNFVIRCPRCRHQILTSGIKADLEVQGLLSREIKRSCKSCGGPRKFRCLKCGSPSKMFRVKK